MKTITTTLMILSIVAYAMISYLPNLEDFLAFPDKLQAEDISRYEQRFESVKRMLPKHGIIGYRSDCTDLLTDINCLAGFYIAQYALSPIILDRSAKQTLLLENFLNADAVQNNNSDGSKKRLLVSGKSVMLYRLDEK